MKDTREKRKMANYNKRMKRSIVVEEDEYVPPTALLRALANKATRQATDFRVPVAASHTAQFYENDSFLCCSVGLFMLTGLNPGTNEGVVVIATKAHCAILRQQLLVMNVPIQAHEHSGRLAIIEADQMLSTFMRNGMPNRSLFFSNVGSFIDDRLTFYPRLRVYGELVNVLWSRGGDKTAQATLALEQLWNELGSTRSYSLLCGYELSKFDKPMHTALFDHICNAHAHVRPAESFDLLNSTDAQMRLIAQLQQKAIALQSEIIQHQATEATLLEYQDKLIKANEKLQKQ